MNTEMLNFGDYVRIATTEFRAHLRLNERIYSSMADADEFFTCIRENNIGWDEELADAYVYGFEFAGGRNQVHPERIETARNNLLKDHYPIELLTIEERRNGKIYYYPEYVAICAWVMFHGDYVDERRPTFNPMKHETEVHYIRRCVHIAMCHERRHSCQNYQDNMRYIAAANVTSIHSEGYATMPHEMDADNFAIYNCTDPLGMYTHAC